MSAIVFPGQGSQYLNMAIDFNQHFDQARRVFQEIEDSCKINIRKLLSENNSDQLNQTKFTQISIFAASMAIYETLLDQIGISIIKPEIVLGHSLGEYSALVANKTLNIQDASVLIKKRGDLMHSAINPNISGMAALIGKSAEVIEDIIIKNNLNVVIANDNSPMQIVISGMIDKINLSEDVFLLNGVKKFVKLNVSAAFHSNLMYDAQVELNKLIEELKFSNPSHPIITNYDACINKDINKIKFSLKNQMSNKVRWTESIKKLEETNIKSIIEIGPGKVLSGLISRISKKFDIISIDKVEDLKKFNNE